MMAATSDPHEAASSRLQVRSIRLELSGWIQGWRPSELSQHVACLEPGCLKHPHLATLWDVLLGDSTCGLLW